MSKTINLQELSERLLRIDNVIIFTHENPDGDALGSVVALLTLFRNLGKKADAYIPEKISERYNGFICDGLYIKTTLPSFDYSYCISLDCSNKKRLAIYTPKEKEIFSLPIINIDHHFDNELYGVENYINPKASATAEIIFDIIKNSPDWSVTPNVATAITLGILTDTGGFRFDNTSSDVLIKAGELINMSADYMCVIKSMYFTKHYNLYKLEADIAVNHLKLASNKKFAYIYLADELLNKYDLDKTDTEGLIDTFRIIDGVIISAIITKKNNGFKVSMRSNNTNYSVVEIAHKLNGGGHKLAAGCFIETDSIEKAEQILLSYVKDLLIE